MEASSPGVTLGRQVRRWRDERKLSAQALANRLAEIGSKLDRRAISKIETEGRSVSVDEWLQLAHALAVPPPLLLIDLDLGGDIAITPKVTLHPWIVWGWLAGEHASPVPSENGGALISRVEEFSRATTAIQLYQFEEHASNAVHNARSAIRDAEYIEDAEALRAAKSAYLKALRELAGVLDSMIENSMTPPGKPAEWIETIRARGISKHPARLQVFRGSADEGPRAGDDPIMRPVTEQDVADLKAATEPNAKAQKD